MAARAGLRCKQISTGYVPFPSRFIDSRRVHRDTRGGKKEMEPDLLTDAQAYLRFSETFLTGCILCNRVYSYEIPLIIDLGLRSEDAVSDNNR